MKILVDEIPESPKEMRCSESTAELNDIYRKGETRDYKFPQSIEVSFVYHRSGGDVLIRGSFCGEFIAQCSRCVRDFLIPIDHDFDFVLSPEPVRPGGPKDQLQQAELGLSFYSGDEIDLSPLIREQVVLALPTRPLCAEDCRGLCGGCGADLNHESCTCSSASDDPRMAFFRTLRIDR